MEKIAGVFKVVSGAIAGVIIGQIGGWTLLADILLSVIVLDFLAGTLRALQQRQICSSISAKGIFKKLGYWIGVALAFQISRVMGQPQIKDIVTGGFIIAETWSIIENLSAMGIMMESLTEILKQAGSKKFTDNK